MTDRLVGALVIGQRPRPDLVEPLRLLLPQAVGLVEVGALDGLTVADLPDAAGASYPLGTRLRDGTAVTVPETFLLPLLQAKLDALEAQGVLATILLCAGSFGALRGKRPLFKPFDIALATLRSLGLQEIAVVTPFKRQVDPIRQRWQAAGFAPRVFAFSLADLNDPETEAALLAKLADRRGNLPDGLLLDYVGHAAEEREALQALLSIPVFDLGDLAIRAVVAACG